jgi:hypothetical protein
VDSEAERKIKEAQALKERRENEIDDDEPDYEKEDDYAGRRKHCWVFI